MGDEAEIGNRIQEILAQCAGIRIEHIESMAAAYLLKTDIDPRDVELVEEWRGREIVWYFRKRGKGIQESPMRVPELTTRPTMGTIPR